MSLPAPLNFVTKQQNRNPLLFCDDCVKHARSSLLKSGRPNFSVHCHDDRDQVKISVRSSLCDSCQNFRKTIPPRKMEKSKQPLSSRYHSKEVLSNACSEIIENLLKQTYEEENPFRKGCPNKSEAPLETVNDKSTLHKRIRKKVPKYRSVPEEGNQNIKDTSNNDKVVTDGRKIEIHNAPEIRYLSQDLVHVNPFEDLLSHNESFFYQVDAQKNYQSINGLPEPDERRPDDEPPPVPVPNRSQISCMLKRVETCDTNTITDICGIINPIPSPNTVMVSTSTSPPPYLLDNPFADLQGHGDHENIENLEYTYTLFGNNCDTVSVRVNFSFYAKLLAFLLTINTLIFLKTIIWTHLIHFLE